MGLMDRAKDAARKGAAEARERGEELLLKRKFNALAEDLGHVTYRQHDGMSGLEGEADSLVAQMKAVRAEIDVLVG